MKEYLIGIAAGYLLGWISRHLASLWNENKLKLESILTTLDERFESITGLDLSDSVHARIDGYARGIVTYLNQLFSDPKQIRRLLRWVYAKGPGGVMDSVKEELEQLKAGTVDRISEEAKKLINEYRQEEAEAMLKARLQVAAPQIANKINVPEVIKNTVKSNPDYSEERFDANRLIAESKARQEALKGGK